MAKQNLLKILSIGYKDAKNLYRDNPLKESPYADQVENIRINGSRIENFVLDVGYLLRFREYLECLIYSCDSSS